MSVSWRRPVRILAIVTVGLGIGLGLFLGERGGGHLQSPDLFLSHEDESEEAQHSGIEVDSDAPRVILDDHRPMMDPSNIIHFRLTSRQDTTISVSFTGSQLKTPSGWEPASEEHRLETWRLTAGVPREICVERPPTLGRWRAYVQYSKQLKGFALLKANLEEAWRYRSFTNWNGKSWGGGRWAGSYEIYSREFPE